MSKPTPSQIMIEINRELATRKAVYPKWIRENKITQKVADHRIACLEALAERYHNDILKEEQLSLFAESIEKHQGKPEVFFTRSDHF